MTNLEWIRTLSEEEFADWLYDEWLHHLQYRWSSSRGGLIIWLKDRKTEPNCSEIPNNCEVKICDTCRNKGFEGCEQPCLGCGCCDLYEPKDEPQTEREGE